MAQGDVTLFHEFKEDVGQKIHNLSSDTFKLGLVTNAVTPAAGTTDPRWGAGGTTNLSTSQVTPGGNYSTGGPTLASSSWSETAGTATFDAADVSIAQNASNPNNARWAIVYNDTSTGKEALAFVDLGGVTDLTAGNFAITWNASGIFSLT
jgi:hypothetical protein